MCQNLFTERIVQNVLEIIILFVLFSYHNLKMRLPVDGKDPFYQFLTFWALDTLLFKKLYIFCVC